MQLCSVAGKVGCCSFSAAKQEAVAVVALQACCGNAEMSLPGAGGKDKANLA